MYCYSKLAPKPKLSAAVIANKQAMAVARSRVSRPEAQTPSGLGPEATAKATEANKQNSEEMVGLVGWEGTYPLFTNHALGHFQTKPAGAGSI